MYAQPSPPRLISKPFVLDFNPPLPAADWLILDYSPLPPSADCLIPNSYPLLNSSTLCIPDSDPLPPSSVSYILDSYPLLLSSDMIILDLNLPVHPPITADPSCLPSFLLYYPKWRLLLCRDHGCFLSEKAASQYIKAEHVGLYHS